MVKAVKANLEVHAVSLTRHKDALNKVVSLNHVIKKMECNLKMLFHNNSFNNLNSNSFRILTQSNNNTQTKEDKLKAAVDRANLERLANIREQHADSHT
jgi:uncharacterized lipoprotein YajG